MPVASVQAPVPGWLAAILRSSLIQVRKIARKT
jgi:hypothetical protein